MYDGREREPVVKIIADLKEQSGPIVVAGQVDVSLEGVPVLVIAVAAAKEDSCMHKQVDGAVQQLAGEFADSVESVVQLDADCA